MAKTSKGDGELRQPELPKNVTKLPSHNFSGHDNTTRLGVVEMNQHLQLGKVPIPVMHHVLKLRVLKSKAKQLGNK